MAYKQIGRAPTAQEIIDIARQWYYSQDEHARNNRKVQLMANITATKLISVDDEDTRDTINTELDQYYWEDNGGETDGPAYLIEASELPEERWQALGLSVQNGTYLDEYNMEEHLDKLDASGFAWTGWQAEGYALIAASPADVEKALMTS